MVKMTTTHIVLVVAITLHWPIKKIDVKNAFLHGDLRETVLTDQPLGFTNPIFPSHVCRLKKALYGLKQVPKS